MTRAYSAGPITAIATPLGVYSSSKPDAPSDRDATGAGEAGFVMLTIWTPLSYDDATTAYVDAPISATATPEAPASSSKPDAPSEADETAAGRAGSVTLMIWTPLSYDDATTAYVDAPISATATPEAPASSSKPDAPSTADETRDGAAGSVTLAI